MAHDSHPLARGATDVVRRLQAAGFTAFWAGGCVRDMLMRREPKDYDIATDAPPDDVVSLFSGSIAVGKAFGVVRVPLGKDFFEVATFREDHEYRDGRRPESVTFTDARTDALRRDFTINAMFYDPVTRQTYDYTGGQQDLDAGVIRCVGDASERLQEDHLRILRAIRFAGSLGFSIEDATGKAIAAAAPRLEKISAERIRDELTRILLESAQAGQSLLLMEALGVLPVVLPEISAMRGVEQPPDYHPEGDVLVHTTQMLDMMKTDNPVLAFSVLLHDVGKPAAFKIMDNRIRFIGHAETGARLAGEILDRLRFSRRDSETVCHCVQNHSRFMQAPEMRQATLRKLLGARTFEIEMELHRLDRACASKDFASVEFLRDAAEQYRDQPALPEPWITGHDILALGVPRGPQVGAWMRLAYEAQLDGAQAGQKELLEWIKKTFSQDAKE